MGVCVYYLQGSCRFGDRCWNEHPRQGGGYDNRGEFLLSANKRSLIRNPVASNSDFNLSSNASHSSYSAANSFSFNKELSAIQTHNRFGAFQPDSRHAQWDDAEMSEEQYVRQSRWNDPGQKEKLFGNQFSQKPFGQSHTTPHFGYTPSAFAQNQAKNFSFSQALSETVPQTQGPFSLNSSRDLKVNQQFQNANVFARTETLKTAEPDPMVYTPISELTEKEKQQFFMQTFTLGKIPVRPPSQEFCR